ncbi:hypothetical protein BLOT_004862 [Blomia tropicalis]|nr:hypothetical protein BLOT_004862 [Blomia tropicalis]
MYISFNLRDHRFNVNDGRYFTCLNISIGTRSNFVWSGNGILWIQWKTRQTISNEYSTYCVCATPVYVFRSSSTAAFAAAAGGGVTLQQPLS